MKSIRSVAALVLLSSVSGASFAQLADVNSNSSANANTAASAGASNAGVMNSTEINSFGAKHQDIDYHAQAPQSLGSYGSFSQLSCVNAIGAAITTPFVSGMMNSPHPDANCEHAVRSNQYGVEANFALSSGKPIQSEDLRAMSVWASCTSSDDDIRMCIRMGKIRYADPDHPDIHDTIPVPVYNDNQLVVVPGRTDNVPQTARIPSYPPGTLLQDGKVITNPIATPSLSSNLPVKVTVTVDDGGGKAHVTRSR